jgi:hypothetical protein
MLDRHHAVRALWESDVPLESKQVHCQIIADLSHLPSEEFWLQMRKNKCTYLTQNGQERDPAELPPDVSSLVDDPYRTLSWLVKNKKGFKATCIPFAEFMWAGKICAFFATGLTITRFFACGVARRVGG